MHLLVPIDVDPYFADFTFSALVDPTLERRLTKRELYQLVYDGRNGDREALARFADTIYCTLRKAALECFERARGPRAITHAEWMHAKLTQLLQILLYEEIHSMRLEGRQLRSYCTKEPPGKGYDVLGGHGPTIQPDEIEATFVPEDNESVNWRDLVAMISKHPKDRVAKLQAWMQAHRTARRSTTVSERGWSKNRRRDEVVLTCLARGMKRELICAELDRWGIAVNLPALQSVQVQKWVDAWADPEGREAIQRLFSKLVPRLRSVKPLAVSE